MTESTNVGRPEEQPESEEVRDDGGMRVTVELPNLTLRLADRATSVDEQWRISATISNRDARVAEALLMQALDDLRNLGGVMKFR